MLLALDQKMFTNIGDNVVIRRDSEDRKTLQLLRFSDSTESRTSSCPILAQFVAEPALRIPDSSVDRRTVSTNWVTSNSSTFTTEILPDDSGLIQTSGSEVLLTARLILPPNVKTSQEVILTSSIDIETAMVGTGGIEIQISARLGEGIDVRAVRPCPTVNSPILRELDGSQICFGITNFSVLQFGRSN